MFYVYVIRSISHPKSYYIGFTENIDQRIKEHNEGKSLHTAKYVPWQLAIYLAVPSKRKLSISSAILNRAQDGHFYSGIFFEDFAGFWAGVPAASAGRRKNEVKGKPEVRRRSDGAELWRTAFARWEKMPLSTCWLFGVACQP
jgi:putative endonuclease